VFRKKIKDFYGKAVVLTIPDNGLSSAHNCEARQPPAKLTIHTAIHLPSVLISLNDGMPMTSRIWNFSAGPAVLPECVLEEARENLLSLGNTGIGICEHSHRGKPFMAIAAEAESLCRELAGIPDEYAVLFLQGGRLPAILNGPYELPQPRPHG
jgi:hypothetical protein